MRGAMPDWQKARILLTRPRLTGSHSLHIHALHPRGQPPWLRRTLHLATSSRTSFSITKGRLVDLETTMEGT